MVRFLAMRAHQLHRVVGLGRAHAGGRLVEAQQLRLGGERDADLEIALLAVREVGGKLVGLAGKADRGQHRFRLVDDVAEVAVVAQHVPAVPARLRGDAHVFQRGGVRQDVGDLVGARDALREIRLGGSPVMSSPLSRMRPEVGRSTPVRQLKNVLLPAPFGPMMARISPRWISKLTLLSAVRPPKRIVRPSVRSTGAVSPPRLSAGEAVATDASAFT